MLRKYTRSALLVLIFLLLSSTISHAELLSATVEFRVFTTGGAPVPAARILLIDNKGAMIANQVSNAEGILRLPLQVEVDPRFRSFEQKVGTVTLIAIADGYNEHVVFEVPITQGAIQTIPMSKINRHRNEPSYQLGEVTKFEVQSLLDSYARQAGLQRQPPTDDDEYSPWSATLAPRPPK